MTPAVKVSIVSNLWIKQMHFLEVGDMMDGHEHTFDHQTLLAYGGVSVEVDGILSEYLAPTILTIRAGKKHSITALVAGTVGYCIHPIRDGERVEDIADPDMTPADGANLLSKFPMAKVGI